MARACDEKRRTLCRKLRDGNGRGETEASPPLAFSSLQFLQVKRKSGMPKRILLDRVRGMISSLYI